jgi:uncharacterized SAM-binding protein YcdF (DUF218 family)
MGRAFTSTVVLAALIAYAFGIWLFLLRPQDSLPAQADAVFVLAGAQSRLPVAQKLIADGRARTLVVSETGAADDPARYTLCHGPRPKSYKLVCRIAATDSTRGEAHLIAGLVLQNKWASVIVVSSHYHLYRARVLVRRCMQARVVMRGSEGDTWWRKAIAIPLEYAKLVRADVWERGC